MIDGIQLENFKSYRKAELPLGPLTVLIGANASGKSNAIEALHLISWLAQAQKLSSIQYQVRESDQVIRGRVSDIGYLGAKDFSLGCTLNHEWNSFSISMCSRDEELHITQERIQSPKETFPLYQIEQPAKGNSNDVRVAYNNFARGGKKPQLTCTDQLAIFTQLGSSARFEGGHQKAQAVIPEVTEVYQDALANVLFLDPVPSKMRGDSHRSDKTLSGDGANLSAVLFNLCKNKETKKVILDFIQSLPEQDIFDITFDENKRGDVLLSLMESFGSKNGRQGKEWDSSLLSDGTLRVLAVAAAVLSAKEGSMVVIEEVDNGVHPSRVHHLLESMLVIAKQRQLRLLITSHNPALLDSLPDEALHDVVFCHRDPKGGDSKLTRLSDMSEFPALMAQGPLGSLLTKGVVDRFVKHPKTSDEKKRQAKEWLARLQGE